jgi:DNA replication protein DnaC
MISRNCSRACTCAASRRSSTTRSSAPTRRSSLIKSSSRGSCGHSGSPIKSPRSPGAKLPEQWTLETFPWKRQPGVNQRQLRTFAELEFIPKAENIVFVGPTGVGKTGLASGLLLKALQNGHRGVFMRAQDLFDEMYASLADRSTRQLLNRLAKVDVLVIDEMGYLNLRPEQTHIFFKLMEERYRQRPTIITTNLDYAEWGNFLGNPSLVTALLSRLRHQCHTVKIDGPSLREPTA